MLKKWLVAFLSGCLGIVLCTNIWAADHTGQKVLFVDSYHEGYAWSDGIEAGIRRTLEGKGVSIKIIHMDTKRHADEASKIEAAKKAKSEIETLKPDVVIAADDNASKYLVAEYYKNASLPFVFCGVNWDAAVYGYPYSNATGMVEVTPIPQLVEQLQKVAKGDRIGFLGPDILTAHKEIENYQKVFGMNPVAYFAKDYEDWKKGFLEIQDKVDIILIDSDGGLYKDNEADMRTFVETNTKKPTGSCYDFMANYAVLTFAKSAEEQGDWAANAALQILDGTPPKDIPITQNKEGSLIVNARIASASATQLPFEVVGSADKIIE
jgi:ABC-type uncharacterized transport system substrate-binding protein